MYSCEDTAVSAPQYTTSNGKGQSSVWRHPLLLVFQCTVIHYHSHCQFLAWFSYSILALPAACTDTIITALLYRCMALSSSHYCMPCTAIIIIVTDALIFRSHHREHSLEKTEKYVQKMNDLMHLLLCIAIHTTDYTWRFELTDLPCCHKDLQ